MTEGVIDVTIGIEANIGVGKSSLAEILSKNMGTQWFPEPVEDNPYLEKYYADMKGYGALMQNYLLSTRFHNMKRAMLSKNSIEDRTLEGDKIFAKVNYLQGTMTKDELDVYNKISSEMLAEIEGMPRKAYDLIIFLDTDIDDMVDKIHKRGRDFELSDDLITYYKLLLEQYQQWAQSYNRGPMLKIDVRGMDFVNNKSDQAYVLTKVYNKLKELQLINEQEYTSLMNKI